MALELLSHSIPWHSVFNLVHYVLEQWWTSFSSFRLGSQKLKLLHIQSHFIPKNIGSKYYFRSKSSIPHSKNPWYSAANIVILWLQMHKLCINIYLGVIVPPPHRWHHAGEILSCVICIISQQYCNPCL